MKQCSNPNCIFYTRLEELPDAYVKCPGCGGMLVDSQTAPGKLVPDARSMPLDTQYPLPGLSQATTGRNSVQAEAPQDVFAGGPNDPYASTPFAVDPYAQAYADTGAHPLPFSGAAQGSGWTMGKKLALAGSALLLVLSCITVAGLLGNRFFPQARVITAAQATETSISSMRPPVNTPIIAPPTPVSSGLPLDTPVVIPSTAVPLPPTTGPLVFPTLPQATAIAQIPTQGPPVAATPGATAPPPSSDRPGGGVTGAQMSMSLDSGQPVGSTNQYGSTDPFNLAVQANYGAGAVTSILTRWYGPDGKLIYEMRRDYTQPGTYYTGFTLRTSGAWTPGNYRVDIHPNDSPAPAYTVPFTVSQ